jgi:hypothetical protein
MIGTAFRLIGTHAADRQKVILNLHRKVLLAHTGYFDPNYVGAFSFEQISWRTPNVSLAPHLPANGFNQHAPLFGQF